MCFFFFFSSRRRHTRFSRDWSSDVCSSDLIFSVYLDDIEIYDWQTGAFGMMQVDPKILQQAQSMAKKEVLERACRGDVMNLALENAQTQLQQLFSLTGAVVTVTTQGAGACQMPTA